MPIANSQRVPDITTNQTVSKLSKEKKPRRPLDYGPFQLGISPLSNDDSTAIKSMTADEPGSHKLSKQRPLGTDRRRSARSHFHNQRRGKLDQCQKHDQAAIEMLSCVADSTALIDTNLLVISTVLFRIRTIVTQQRRHNLRNTHLVQHQSINLSYIVLPDD
ncbi:hypothetical protein [Variovorax sp. UC122_21]|uniref:hypothetical protein n=1 Tax=Variovorax sp. UC122_21 TaxID=3374554 RepID=UPI0037568C67